MKKHARAARFGQSPSAFGHRRRSRRERTYPLEGIPLSSAEATETTSPTPQNPTDPGHDHEGHDHEGHDHEGHGHEGHSHEGHQHGPAFHPELMREVEVTIPADQVGKAMRTAVKRYTRQARIPGFRAGKAPESLIRSRFGEQIRQEVLEQVLPPHFHQAVAEGNHKLVSQPQVVDMKMEDGEPLWFKANFEVLPEFSVEGYQDVKVEKGDPSFSEEEFQTELDRVRDSRSTMEPVEEDRPLQDGDWAQITLKGEVKPEEGSENPEPAEPITGEDVLLEIGGKNTIEAFSAALRGARVGQELKFEATYPAEFGERRLAGKTVSYDVEVKGIKKRVQPELNDDFARELGGDFESYDQFVTQFRENLQNEKTRRTATENREKLMDALVARYNFPVPETLVQQQIDARLERGLRALAGQGMREEDMRRLDFPRLRAAQRDAATSEVKGFLILDRIAEAENVTVSDEEVERELELLSMQLREPVETLRSRLTADGGLARIREQLKRDKTGQLLSERL
jgi:trigger factor